jgi:hypothetical protein
MRKELKLIFEFQYMEIYGSNIKQKLSKKYCCEVCDYNTDRKSNIQNHYNSAKHTKELNGTKNKQILSNNNYVCEYCNKIYQTTSGLWKHTQKCIKETINKEKDETTTDTNIDIFDKNLILTLIQQNNELQKQMLEVIKNGTNNTTHTNSHNKSFNLQFFLNEECKDALNIAEFVSSIKVQLEDLETTGRLGYVEGVSRIINKNLNDLDETKRPIHCSDVKREVLYIKNDNQWVKENENKPILTKAIKQIASENIKQISEWRKKYPDCTDSDSRKNDLYLNIVSNAMSGSTTEEQSNNYEKIITKVAKEVVIEK